MVWVLLLVLLGGVPATCQNARGCTTALRVAAEVETAGCAGFEAFEIDGQPMIAGGGARAPSSVLSCAGSVLTP